MASPKSIREKLEEWATLQIQIEKVWKQRTKELDPFIREHQEKIAPVIEKFDLKANPLREKSDELEKQIAAMVKSNADGEGNPRPATIVSERATVILQKSEGARVVAPQKFFDVVKTKTSAFWECVTVQVGKADKLLGKAKIDEISENKTTFPVSISLNK